MSAIVSLVWLLGFVLNLFVVWAQATKGNLRFYQAMLLLALGFVPVLQFAYPVYRLVQNNYEKK